MSLQSTVTSGDSPMAMEAIEVSRAYNFGYAGRSQEEALAHVEELRELGFPAPDRIPAIFPIEVALVTNAKTVRVAGDQTYGEVEFALIRTGQGWVVAAASDHSDMTIEAVSTARAKTVYPDILSSEVWRLEDVAPHWDSITMTCERRTVDGPWEAVQEGSVAALLHPDQLIEELATRAGETATPGTVILSGTIGGELRPGAAAWRNTLTDPVSGKSLVVEYAIQERPVEI